MIARAGQPLPVRVPPALRAGLDAAPADRFGWQVLSDWCRQHADPWLTPLHDAMPWADRIGCDDYGLRAALVHGAAVHWMRWVPAGRFVMGTPTDEPGHKRRERQRPVTLTRSFWMSESAVDQALWWAVTGLEPSRVRGPRHPVHKVNVQDVDDFIAALNLQCGRVRLRLPTEAEWECACRAGTTTATWAGDMLVISEFEAVPHDDIAWYGGTSRFTGPRRSDQGTPNPLGLRDMLGNIEEWCADWFTAQPTGTVDPTGPDRGADRVIRGGSWRGFAVDLRAGRRARARPSERSDTVGFRLVQPAR